MTPNLLRRNGLRSYLVPVEFNTVTWNPVSFHDILMLRGVLTESEAMPVNP